MSVPCLHCNHIFIRVRPQQKSSLYCSRQCRTRAYAKRHRATIPVVKSCKHCATPVTSSWKHVKYCSRDCRQSATAARYRDVNVRLPLGTGVTGAIAELAVSTDLLRKGFEVFRSVAPTCSCDLAILKDGKLLRVEVTTGTKDLNGNVQQCTTKERFRDIRFDILAVYIAVDQQIVYRPEPTLPFSPSNEALGTDSNP